jgi:hypothetical protein
VATVHPGQPGVWCVGHGVHLDACPEPEGGRVQLLGQSPGPIPIDLGNVSCRLCRRSFIWFNGGCVR